MFGYVSVLQISLENTSYGACIVEEIVFQSQIPLDIELQHRQAKLDKWTVLRTKDGPLLTKLDQPSSSPLHWFQLTVYVDHYRLVPCM